MVWPIMSRQNAGCHGRSPAKSKSMRIGWSSWQRLPALEKQSSCARWDSLRLRSGQAAEGGCRHHGHLVIRELSSGTDLSRPLHSLPIGFRNVAVVQMELEG